MATLPWPVRTRYNYHSYAEPTGITFDPSEGKTQQHYKDECDINTIMKKYRVTGNLDGEGNPRPPMFGDFTNAPEDFLAAQAAVDNAWEEFGRLPSDLRERFQNDPSRLLAFVADAANRPEAVKLGLIPKPVPEAPTAPAAAPAAVVPPAGEPKK